MKIICVPKNKEALHRLDCDKAKEDDLFEISLEDKVLSELFKIGFFQKNNKLAHANVDDFDEAIIDETY